MCLIAFAWRGHPRYELALIANRDEFHGRPAAAAGFDPEAVDVYGGRDLVAGGGWLLASTRGRMAAVTNVRVPALAPAPRSRGALVREFARGGQSASDYATGLRAEAAGYAPFNLLVWDGGSLQFASNHPDFAVRTVLPGRHAMSNGPLDALWPKSSRAVQGLSAWLDEAASLAAEPDPAPLFAALADRTPAPDAALPETGVGLAQERFLSSPFILSPEYGTRCSTVLLVEAGRIVFAERRFDPDGTVAGESRQVLPRRLMG